MIKINSSLAKYVNIILTIFASVFSIVYGKHLLEKAAQENIQFNLVYLVLSLVLFLLFYLLLAFNWSLVLEMVTNKKNLNYMKSFFASQPYKYLPTSIFSFSYRAVYAKKQGISVKNSSIAQLVEYVTIIACSFITASIMYMATINYYYVFLLVPIVCTMFINKTITVIYKNSTITMSTKKLATSMNITILAWVMCGVSLYYLAKSIGFSYNLLELIITNSMAYTFGIIAFFAPGGIGVREYIFSLFGIASILIIYWRLLTLSVDLITGLIAIHLINIELKNT
jgi:uncharacterized membrane protein YbhN (UPF0104 family)